MATVKVIRLPGTVQNVEVAAGATIQDALDAANTSLNSGETLKLNGLEADTSAFVNAGDAIIISKGAKGNVDAVRVVTLVLGQDVSTMSEANLFAAARKLRNEIDELTTANKGIDSTKIAEEIVDLSEALVKVKDLLDAK